MPVIWRLTNYEESDRGVWLTLWEWLRHAKKKGARISNLRIENPVQDLPNGPLKTIKFIEHLRTADFRLEMSDLLQQVILATYKILLCERYSRKISFNEYKFQPH